MKNSNEFANVAFVFLDRDGVLNRKPPPGQFVTRWEDFELLPGADNAIAQLNRMGRKVLVVTNQRGVALGLYTLEELARMHGKLQAQLAAGGAHLDGIYVCPHQDGECMCRKPSTGLFEQAFRDFPAANPGNSVMVGDSLRDIQAGRSLGMHTVFVDDGADESSKVRMARSLAHLTVASLPEFVRRYFPDSSPGV